MKEFKESLKSALCNNDIDFLQDNKNRFSINERFEDEENDTLLLYAISDAKNASYKYLLANYADTSLFNDEGENIVHAIVYSGDTERLHSVLNAYKVNINFQTKDGATPLLLALSLEDGAMAQTLIKHGADVKVGDDDGLTPLHLAAQLGDIEIVKLIAEKGIDLFLKTKAGNIALALAVNSGHVETIKYLYSKMY